MTPAIEAAKRAGIAYQIHEYRHAAGAFSYGEEAAQALGVVADRVFKTLIVALHDDRRPLAVGVVPVAGKLDLKAFAAALQAKKATMADAKDAERATGYVLGGISPLGQRKRLALLLDDSAQGFDTIYVSAGRRGLEIELAPSDLLALTGGSSADISR